MNIEQKLNQKAESLIENFVYSKKIKDLPDLIDTQPTHAMLDNMNCELAEYWDNELGGEKSFLRDVPNPSNEQWERHYEQAYGLSDIILREVWNGYGQAKISDRLHDHSHDEDWKKAKHKYY